MVLWNKYRSSTAILSLALLATGLAPVGARARERGTEEADTLSASQVMVRLPAQVLELLTPSMRQDMLDWYATDSVAPVRNLMEGESLLVPPVTQDYLKMSVTPVTTLTVKMLPLKGKPGRLAMTVYTIGDSVQAKDSDIRFYDASLTELPREKYIKIAATEDFLDLTGLPHEEKKELLGLVPFPTVEYTVSPGSDLLTAKLTVGEFLGREALEKLTPHMHRQLTYRWDGRKFKLEKK